MLDTGNFISSFDNKTPKCWMQKYFQQLMLLTKELAVGLYLVVSFQKIIEFTNSSLYQEIFLWICLPICPLP